MRAFGKALAESGFLAMGICLPGHGTTPEDLEDRGYEEWVDEVTRGYRILRKRHPCVLAAGMSTGALVLLAVAEREPFSGLILFSPFLRLRHRLAPLVGVLRFFKRFQTRPLSPKLANHYYRRRPLNGVYQIYLLINRLQKNLGQITAPVLVFSAEGDSVVNTASAHELFRRLGSNAKWFHQFGPEVPHVLTTRENPLWEETVERSLQFFKELALPKSPLPATVEKGF